MTVTCGRPPCCWRMRTVYTWLTGDGRIDMIQLRTPRRAVPVIPGNVARRASICWAGLSLRTGLPPIECVIRHDRADGTG